VLTIVTAYEAVRSKDQPKLGTKIEGVKTDWLYLDAYSPLPKIEYISRANAEVERTAPAGSYFREPLDETGNFFDRLCKYLSQLKRVTWANSFSEKSSASRSNLQSEDEWS
jgi:hypothetical protein